MRTPAPAVHIGTIEPDPLREALRLCGTHLRFALLFSALVNLAYLAPTLYMLAVYDMVVPAGSGVSLVFVTIALGLTLLTLVALDRIRARILLAASVRLDRVFAGRLFRRAMQAASQGPQPRLNQTIREFDVIRAAVTGPAALALFDAPWIPIYIGVCFYLHWAVGTLALASAIVLFGLAIWNERATHRFSARALEASAASFAAQEAAGGSAEVVRALGMSEAFVTQFEAARAQAALPQMEAAHANGRIGGLIRFLRLLLQSAALGLGAWLAINKEISGGAIFASSMLASRALSPIDQIVAQWRTVSQAITAYQTVRSQMAAEPPVVRTSLPVPSARLTVSHVAVVAPGRVLLQGIGFSAEGGQAVGVVGPSGAGKTTLMQVLANARAPDQGEVRLDGARYGDFELDRLGRFIGYMPQDCVLFPGTVKDNISRFDIAAGVDPAAVDEGAVAAAVDAEVHEMILGLPLGYDTPLGPRGRGLSAGQQQRIALARALYGDPMLFVFDEPNAAVDADGEAALLRAIERLKARGALVVLAAHRAGLLASVDFLAVLRGGRLERFGPRQEVMEMLRLGDGGRAGPMAAAGAARP